MKQALPMNREGWSSQTHALIQGMAGALVSNMAWANNNNLYRCGYKFEL